MRELQQLLHKGSAVAARGFRGMGSLIVAHELSCPEACGVFPAGDGTSVSCMAWWFLSFF